MRVYSNSLMPYPGYEDHVAMTLETNEGAKNSPEEQKKILQAYQLDEGMTMEDIQIPGTEAGKTIRLRVIKPAGLTGAVPVIMDVHGGGFIGGCLDIDNARCISLAKLTKCIVVSVEYRLSDATVHFPAPLLDCHTAYLWLTQNAASLGGDPIRIGLHGTSAGGCLCGGLALYLRDRGEQPPALTVLVCPTVNNVRTPSNLQFGSLGASRRPYPKIGYVVYSGMNNGEVPSYYALPGKCEDLRGLSPHMVVAAEYDPLRDEALHYAMRLLENDVPCEILSAPRVSHGFCVIDHPLTRWVHRGIAASFRREFGMKLMEI